MAHWEDECIYMSTDISIDDDYNRRVITLCGATDPEPQIITGCSKTCTHCTKMDFDY